MFILKPLLFISAVCLVAWFTRFLMFAFSAKMSRWKDIAVLFPPVKAVDACQACGQVTGSAGNMGFTREFPVKLCASGVAVSVPSRWFSSVFIPESKVRSVLVDALDLIEKLAPDLWQDKKRYEMHLPF